MCGETYYLWSAVDSDLASRELRTRPELGFPPTPDQATPVLLVLSFQSVLVRLRVSSLGKYVCYPYYSRTSPQST